MSNKKLNVLEMILKVKEYEKLNKSDKNLLFSYFLKQSNFNEVITYSNLTFGESLLNALKDNEIEELKENICNFLDTNNKQHTYEIVQIILRCLRRRLYRETSELFYKLRSKLESE